MALRINPATGQLDLVLDKSSEIKYTNLTSGLTAVNVQDALDEIEAQVSSLPDPIVYKGTWNASTNTPTLSNTNTGVTGFLYQVNVAGSVNFGAGAISFDIGDKVVNNGTTWDKWDMTDAVTSVNGLVGAVVLTTSNISEGSNLYFTDERAQDAVANIFSNTATINFTYNDAANFIQADVNNSSITNNKVATGIDAIKIADGSVSNTEFQYLDGVTSAIQPQLALKAPLASPTFTGTVTTPVTASRALVTGASSELAASTTTATEIGYVSGVTSAIQTQINTKAPTASPTFSGTITTPLTASRALVTGAASEVAISPTTSTEIGYVSGVTSAIQTQLNAKVATVTGDILAASFTGAQSVASPTNVTGLAFSNGVVRSFNATVNVLVSATSSLYESFYIRGIQRGADWVIEQNSVGDTSNVVFSITTAGQLQYISSTYTGFSSLTIKFKADTLGV